MNGINRKLCGLALAALAATALLGQAQAAPVVSIDPATQTINFGDTTSVNIIVSGLTDLTGPVGGFSLTLSFLSSILSGDSFVNDPDGKMGVLFLDLSCGFSGGPVTDPCTVGTTGSSPLDLFFVADFDETEESLATAQGGGFKLATVSFTGVKNGLSPLNLSNVFLSNWDGTMTLAGVTTQNGEICVGGNCATVPEPATYALVGAALAALALRRRRQIDRAL